MKNKGTPKAIWFQDINIFKELKLISVIKGLSIEKTIIMLIEVYKKTNENKED